MFDSDNRGQSRPRQLTLSVQSEMRRPRVDVERRRLRSIGDGGNDEPRVDVDDAQRRVGGLVGFGVGQRRRRRLDGGHFARRPEPHDGLQVLLQVGKRVPKTQNIGRSEQGTTNVNVEVEYRCTRCLV